MWDILSSRKLCMTVHCVWVQLGVEQLKQFFHRCASLHISYIPMCQEAVAYAAAVTPQPDAGGACSAVRASSLCCKHRAEVFCRAPADNFCRRSPLRHSADDACASARCYKPGSLHKACTHQLIEAFLRRERPSDLHHTYAFPSGHTTAATFIVGALLFVALPLCAPALTEEEAPSAAASASGR